MVEIALPQERIGAGVEYLQALQILGLDPEGLLWAHFDDRPHWVLLLVTSLYDAAGPLELTKFLFKAYNAALLPSAIDPFDVDAYSPDQELIHGIRRAAGMGRNGRAVDARLKSQIRVGSVVIPSQGILACRQTSTGSLSALSKHWDRLRTNLGLVAA